MRPFDSAGTISSLIFLRPMFSFCSVRITERSLETNVNTEGERWLARIFGLCAVPFPFFFQSFFSFRFPPLSFFFFYFPSLFIHSEIIARFVDFFYEHEDHGRVKRRADFSRFPHFNACFVVKPESCSAT